MRNPLLPFPLGTIAITEGASAALQSTEQTPEQLLARHSFGDWGELDEEDWERNNHALSNALRLLSSYHLRDKTDRLGYHRMGSLKHHDPFATRVLNLIPSRF